MKSKGRKMIKNFKVMMLFLALMAMVRPSEAENMLQVKGSDTMVNTIQRMSEVYMEKHPDRYLAVTGGGSGTGIAALRNRTVDIANSSRKMKVRERINLERKGVEPFRIVVGRDCVTIVVNKANKIDKLTGGQLGAIFRGEIKNWKDVGGEDIPITLYGRQSNSGTYELFRNNILQSDYSDKMRRMNGNGQIIEAVKSDVSGIGFVGRGHAKNSPDLKVIAIAENESSKYINPLEIDETEAEKYLIVRPLNQYVNGKPSGEILDFINFELSPEGQKIFEEMGFFPVSEKYKKQNAEMLTKS